MLQCLSSLVVFVTAFFFGVMARRSPKKDWEFIMKGPALLLLIISSALAQTEFSVETAAIAAAEREKHSAEIFRCFMNTGKTGYIGEKCDIKYTPPLEPPGLKPSLKWFRNSFISIFLDIPFELGGIWLGGLFAGRQKSIPKVT